ncbi:MAG: DUF1028 domain-containing protein [Saprospiraceae bacterium]
MKFLGLLFLLFTGFFFIPAHSQDTFSIVAVDSITGEVGSAGASCVDLFNTGFTDDSFLGELFPGVGAINSQAYYLPANQANARARMQAGDSPSEIIEWLQANDVEGRPQFRQYGIVAMVNGSPQSAGHTGASTDDYKNHLLGPNYAIQGNILLGQEVLDSMEARFVREEGDLACKLMAALQGANMVGADTRCSSNGSSSLFAFVKVAKPDDSFGQPSFKVSVRTRNGARIEPIDSLQSKFDAVHNCKTSGSTGLNLSNPNIRIFPNPVEGQLNLELEHENHEDLVYQLYDITGKMMIQDDFMNNTRLDFSSLNKGAYFLKITNGDQVHFSKVIKN